MAYEHTLSNLRTALKHFHVDRPVLQKHNADPVTRVNAFKDEVAELNGPDDQGFFGPQEIVLHPERLPVYRQQEVTDIMLIGLSLIDIFNFQIKERSIEAKAATYAELLGLEVVANDVLLKPETAFNAYQESVYEDLKRRLNEQMVHVTVEKMADPQFAQYTLEHILTYCYLIFYLMGLNPIRAGFEKIARNMLKYLAADYQPGEKTYKEREKESKHKFDGPKAADGSKPQWGTREFYGFYEMLKTLKESQVSARTHAAVVPSLIEMCVAGLPATEVVIEEVVVENEGELVHA